MKTHRIDIDIEMWDSQEAQDIARDVRLNVSEIVLPTLRLILWFCEQTAIRGTNRAALEQSIDRAAGVPGFAHALLMGGWLQTYRGRLMAAGALGVCLKATRERINNRERKERQRNGGGDELVTPATRDMENGSAKNEESSETCDENNASSHPLVTFLVPPSPTPLTPSAVFTPSETSLSETAHEPVHDQEQEQQQEYDKGEQLELTMPENPLSMTVVKDSKNFLLPIWVPLDAWEAWIEMRTKMRKPLTDHAKGLAVKKLDALRGEGGDVRAVLEQSILNGWTGVFDARRGNGSRPPPQGHADYSKVHYGTGDEKISWLEDEDA